jgi:DNA modification methylase
MNELTNKIHFGDAYELIKRIPDKSIDLIYTDIPYYHVSGGMGDVN